MKILHSDPATGVKLVTAMRYVEVYQLTYRKASRSVAIEPWIVEIIETLQVRMKMSAHTEKQITAPRFFDIVDGPGGIPTKGVCSVALSSFVAIAIFGAFLQMDLLP